MDGTISPSNSIKSEIGVPNVLKLEAVPGGNGTFSLLITESGLGPPTVELLNEASLPSIYGEDATVFEPPLGSRLFDLNELLVGTILGL